MMNLSNKSRIYDKMQVIPYITALQLITDIFSLVEIVNISSLYDSSEKPSTSILVRCSLSI